MNKRPDASPEAFVTLLQLIVFPAISVAAIWLAVRNERIGLAALMASASLVFSQLSAIFFTIVVTIFGI
ncbi:MAG: hypothetical protein JWN71_4224 [Xanthobacteraceae bacterium]|nr:hypothetical protein [Xanthobacteraceae bacterium]